MRLTENVEYTLRTVQDLAKEQIKCPICCAEKNHSCTTPIHKKSKPKIHSERLDEYHTQIFERIAGVKNDHIKVLCQ